MYEETNGSKMKEQIGQIGKDLISRAEDIARDIKGVRTITIHAEITPDEIINYDVTKNYGVFFEEE